MKGILQKIGIIKPESEDEDKLLYNEEDIIANIFDAKRYVVKVDIMSEDDVKKVSKVIFDKEPILIIDLSQLTEKAKASFAGKLKTVLTTASAQTKYRAFYVSACPDIIIAVPDDFIVEKA